MKKTRQSFLALLLAVTMLVTLVPATLFAEDAGTAVGLTATATKLAGPGLAALDGGMRAAQASPDPGVLTKFFNPAKYYGQTVRAELDTIEAALGDMDYELALITGQMGELKNLIQTGVVDAYYQQALTELTPVTERLDRLLNGNTQSLQNILDLLNTPAFQDKINAGEAFTQQQHAELKVLTDNFIKSIRETYGSAQSGTNNTFEKDIHTLASCLYSTTQPGGALVEAQIDASILQNIYEFAVYEDAGAIFRYIARYMYCVVYLDTLFSKFIDDEYAEYISGLGNDSAWFPYKSEYDQSEWSDASGPAYPKINEAVNLQNQANEAINTGGDASGLAGLLPLYDENGNLITETMALHGSYLLPNGNSANSLTVMRLRIYSTKQEVLVPVDVMTAGQLGNITGTLRADYGSFTPQLQAARHASLFYNEALMSRDGRFTIPTGEEVYKDTLWPATETDPVRFFNGIGVPVGPATAFLINHVTANANGVYAYQLLDANHAKKGVAGAVTVHNLCSDGTVPPGAFSDGFDGSAKDMKVLPLFLDNRAYMGGWRVDNSFANHGEPGTFKPTDYTNWPLVTLTDGDVLDVSGFNAPALDLNGATVTVSGRVKIIGRAGTRYENLQICLLEGADLTLENFSIERNSSGDPATGATYSYRTLMDPDTGVKVSGSFTDDAVLAVKKNSLHEKGSCKVCDDIRARQDKGELIVLYDIGLSSGSYTGDLDVEIPVEDKYNGQTVFLIHCKEKVQENRTIKVENGMAKGTFSSLSPFAVAAQSSGTIAINDSTIPQTGDAANQLPRLLIMLAALAGCASLLLWRNRRCTKRHG